MNVLSFLLIIVSLLFQLSALMLLYGDAFGASVANRKAALVKWSGVAQERWQTWFLWGLGYSVMLVFLLMMAVAKPLAQPVILVFAGVNILLMLALLLNYPLLNLMTYVVDRFHIQEREKLNQNLPWVMLLIGLAVGLLGMFLLLLI